MNDSASLLAQLRDIHEPAAPAATSPVWFIAAVFAIVVIVVYYLCSRAIRRRLWVRDSIAQLDNIDTRTGATAVTDVARLLRGIVLGNSTQQDIKHIHGQPWLEQLDQFFRTRFFTCAEGQVLGSDLYQQQNPPRETCEKLIRQTRKLIKRRGRTLW